jgi:DNA polymerase-1
MHNAKFDILMFLRGAPFGWKGVDLTQNLEWDTELANWVMTPLERKGLKATATRMWGYDEAAEQREMQTWLESHGHKKFEIWYAPGPVHLPYARQDAELTFRLWKHQLVELQREPVGDDPGLLLQLIEREIEVCKVLVGMESRGIGFDRNHAALISTELEGARDEIEKDLPFKPTDMKAVKYWQKLDPHNPVWAVAKRTPTGRISMDKEAMPVLLEASLPFAKEYGHWGDLDLAITRYYGDRDEIKGGNRSATWRKLTGADGRLRPSFQQDGTTSTRFSCRRVNLQAIPKEETSESRYPSPRSCMVARSGYVLVEMDLSQAEVRVAAAVAQCEGLRKVVNSGQNIHQGTARLIFPELDWTRPDWKTAYAKEYHAAKTLNFAIQYGAGVEKIAHMLHCSVTEAEAYRNRYHMAFPEIKQTMKVAQHKADTRGYVYLISGRKRYFGQEEATFKALNAIVQGNVAEAMKDLMVWVNKFYPEYMLIQIHDSIVMEVPENSAELENVENIKRHAEDMLTEMFGISMKADLKIWQPEGVPA